MAEKVILTNEQKQGRIDETLVKLNSFDFHVSPTFLTYFFEAPRRAVYYRAGLLKSTKTMLDSTIFHTMLLEEDKFDDKYIILPPHIITPSSQNQKNFIDLIVSGAETLSSYEQCYSSKAKKADVDQLLNKLGCYIQLIEKAEERTLVKQELYHSFEFLIDQARLDPRFERPMLEEGECEKKIFWRFKGHDHVGIVDKCIFPTNVYDIKYMSGGVDVDAARKNLYSYKMPFKAVMYLIGLGDLDLIFQWLCFDKNANCNIITLSDADRSHYLRAYEYILKKLDDCVMGNRWMEGSNFWAETFDGSFFFEKPKYISII